MRHRGTENAPPILSGEFEVLCKDGPRKVPFEFKTPDVEKGLARRCVLKLEFSPAAGVRFPRYATLDESINLVVVGRKSYAGKFAGLSRKLGLHDYLENGGRMVVFEQTGELTEELANDRFGRGTKPFPGAPAPAGLRMESRVLRNGFITDRDTPVLQGFRDEDFANWRSATDIVESYPVPETKEAGPIPINEPMRVKLLDQAA